MIFLGQWIENKFTLFSYSPLFILIIMQTRTKTSTISLTSETEFFSFINIEYKRNMYSAVGISDDRNASCDLKLPLLLDEEEYLIYENIKNLKFNSLLELLNNIKKKIFGFVEDSDDDSNEDEEYPFLTYSEIESLLDDQIEESVENNEYGTHHVTLKLDEHDAKCYGEDDVLAGSHLNDEYWCNDHSAIISLDGCSGNVTLSVQSANGLTRDQQNGVDVIFEVSLTVPVVNILAKLRSQKVILLLDRLYDGIKLGSNNIATYGELNADAQDAYNTLKDSDFHYYSLI